MLKEINNRLDKQFENDINLLINDTFKPVSKAQAIENEILAKKIYTLHILNKTQVIKSILQEVKIINGSSTNA